MSIAVRRTPMLLLIAALISLGLAACGGGGSSTSGGTASATEESEGSPTEASQTNGVLAEVEKKVAEAEKPPVPISLPELSETPPRGKTIAYVTCPAPECLLAEEATKEAAALLGWNVNVYQGGLTPETQVTGNKEAVQAHPDGIISVTVLPIEVIKEPFEEAEKANIPIVTIGSLTPAEGPIIAIGAANKKDLETQSEAMANWVIADSGGKANVVAYSAKGLETQELPAEIASTLMKEDCPECTVNIESFNFTDAGTKFPGEVVSYLQKNPEVEYVILPSGSTSAGVASAIKAAGLPLPKITTRVSTPENFANVKSGTEAIAVPEDIQGGLWFCVDALARHFVGDPVDVEPPAQYQILTKESIKNPNEQWRVPDLKQSFEKIWKVNG